MIKKNIYFILVFFIFLFSCSNENNKENIIEKCIDGDTVIINGEKIRILEVDTFESRRNNQAKKQAKKFKISLKTVIEKGQKAKELCDKDWKGKSVKLTKWKIDRYGRTLAYIEGYPQYMIKNEVGYYVKPY